MKTAPRVPHWRASLGGTTETPPAECTGDGFLLEMHPFLRHYLDGADCTEGPWHGFTSGSFDAGWQEVEVSISYVTDPASGGVGAFVDDMRFVIDGEETLQDGFEGAESTWTVGGPPEGSPPNSSNWQIGEQLVNFYAGTSTEDTLLLGFGLEQLATDEDRSDLLERALDGLLG